MREPKSDDDLDSRRALAAIVFAAAFWLVGFFTSVPSSRLPVVTLFNATDIILAGCAVGFGLLSIARRESLWLFGAMAAAAAALPFFLKLFPGFR